MGLRGKLPATRTPQSDRLDCLDAPDWLEPLYARPYWTRHCDYLDYSGLLTTETADSFALLSDLYGRLREMTGTETTPVFLNTMKAYHTLAKLFRHVPIDKPGEIVERRHNTKEFEI